MTRIKICGLTQPEDVKMAKRLNAWALGFIFFQESPRFVSPKKVKQILVAAEINENLKSPLAVGVFVNSPLSEIQDVVGIAGLTAVQLHGEEEPDFVNNLINELPSVQVICALRPKNKEELNILDHYSAEILILLDTYLEGVRGGTGRLGNWDLAIEAQKKRKIILSGGLNPINVLQGITTVEPYAVDVSSGVEISPGKKSLKQMSAFFERVKERKDESKR